VLLKKHSTNFMKKKERGNNLHVPGPAQRALRQYAALTQDVVVRQYVILTEAPSNKLQAPSTKPQASSHP